MFTTNWQTVYILYNSNNISYIIDSHQKHESDDAKLCYHMRLLISKKVTNKWKRFARNLEVQDEVLDQIEDSDDFFKDKIFEVINHFNAEKGELKWNQTKYVLKEIGLDNVILKLEETYLKSDDHHSDCAQST